MPPHKSLTELVQIGIATKNRWTDLQHTLAKLSEFGLSEARILIIDDDSDVQCPFDVRALCHNAEITRTDTSRGYIVRRNEIARSLDAKYYLSLDDDSFPTKGSLEAAVAFADSQPDTFCLSFPIYNSVAGRYQLQSLRDEPYAVRAFVGCSHLVNRELFLDVGGYRTELIHQGEEMDIAARAFARGLTCRHYPGLQTDHMVSLSGRSLFRMDYYGGRNQLLWNDWYVPPSLRPYRQLRTLVNRGLGFLRSRRTGHVLGAVAGLSDIQKFKALRAPMDEKSYRAWLRMPPY